MLVEDMAAGRADLKGGLPRLGLGLGLRSVHFGHILTEWPEVGWFEAISENFMDSGGRPRQVIRQVAERYPVVLHGVSLSIGSTAPLDFGYLGKLKALAAEVRPAWVSDHLCWTGVQGLNTHDLLPLPLNGESLAHVSARVRQVQDFLGRPLILENPSTYVSFAQSTIPEPEFLRRLSADTGCGLLLDVNNVFVTCYNSGADPVAYLQSFPCECVVQMHLAGHQNCGTHIIDTHDQPVLPNVWELFRLAWKLTGGSATLLEWDGNIPAFDVCLAEVHKAEKFMEGAFDPARVRSEPGVETESVSNPVDFLVADAMQGTMMETHSA